MSVAIDCAGRNILHVKNSTFDSLHKGIMIFVKEERQQLSSTIEKLLEAMDQDIWGGGVIDIDIVDYLKLKNEALLFAYLVKEGIEKKQAMEHSFSDEALKRLWDFHKAIVDYAQGLITNPK